MFSIEGLGKCEAGTLVAVVGSRVEILYKCFRGTCD